MTNKSWKPALLGALSAFIFLCILARLQIWWLSFGDPGHVFPSWAEASDGIPYGLFAYLCLPFPIGSLIGVAFG